jgi:hypothetical protein
VAAVTTALADAFLPQQLVLAVALLPQQLTLVRREVAVVETGVAEELEVEPEEAKEAVVELEQGAAELGEAVAAELLPQQPVPALAEPEAMQAAGVQNSALLKIDAAVQ